MTGWSAVRQVIGLEDIPLIRCDRVRVRVEFGYEAYGPSAKGSAMADSIYSVSEIVGSSTEGIDDAIRGAVRGHQYTGPDRERRAHSLPGHLEGRFPAG
jgi:hypothetical protein